MIVHPHYPQHLNVITNATWIMGNLLVVLLWWQTVSKRVNNRWNFLFYTYIN